MVDVDQQHWVPDESCSDCMICECPFAALVRRRHHCRRCGALVCGACSRHRLASREDATVEERCCDDCWTAHHERLIRQDERLSDLTALSKLRQRLEQTSSLVEHGSSSLVRVFGLDGTSATLTYDEEMTAGELAKAAGDSFESRGDCGLWSTRNDGRLDSLEAVHSDELVSNVLARWRVASSSRKLVLPVLPRRNTSPQDVAAVPRRCIEDFAERRNSAPWFGGDAVSFGGMLAVMRGNDFDNDFAPDARDGGPPEGFAIVWRSRPTRRWLLVRAGGERPLLPGDVAPRSSTSLDEIDLKSATRVVAGTDPATVVVILKGGARRIGLLALSATEAARWRAELRRGISAATDKRNANSSSSQPPSRSRSPEIVTSAKDDAVILAETEDVVEALYAERGRFRTARAELEAVGGTLSTISTEALALASPGFSNSSSSCCCVRGGGGGGLENDDQSNRRSQQSFASSLLSALFFNHPAGNVATCGVPDEDELERVYEEEAVESARGDTLAAAHAFAQACAAASAQAQLFSTIALDVSRDVEFAVASHSGSYFPASTVAIPERLVSEAFEEADEVGQEEIVAVVTPPPGRSFNEPEESSSAALVASLSEVVCARLAEDDDHYYVEGERSSTDVRFHDEMTGGDESECELPDCATSMKGSFGFEAPLLDAVRPTFRLRRKETPKATHVSGKTQGSSRTETTTFLTIAEVSRRPEGSSDSDYCVVKAALKHDVALGHGALIVEKRALSAIGKSEFCTKLLGSFHDANICYVALEFGERGDLSGVIRSGEALCEHMSRFYLACVGHALEHCRLFNVVHRDVRLDNVVVCENGYAKLANFGLATTCPPGAKLKTFVASWWETLAAPECCAGDTGYDGGVDWWAAGVLAFQLVTATHPFFPGRYDKTESAFAAVVDAAETGKFPSATSAALRDHLSRSYASLVSKLLDSRHRRIATLAALRDHAAFDDFDWPGFDARRMDGGEITISKPKRILENLKDYSLNETTTFYDGHVVCFTGHSALFKDF